MRRAAVAVAALAVAALLPAAGTAATPAGGRPVTVPALREWTGAPGVFRFRRDARVVPQRRSLRGEARTLASDLSELTGRVVAVARTGARTRGGDVLLRLRTRDTELGGEGYRLRIGRAVTIDARRRAGVFYGGRTLLQLRRGGRDLPRGRARDWPVYRERGLMLDNGRQFFTRAWLERRIADLADLKLNLLHLHLSDNQGFRIESETHPEIVSEPHLTKADVRALVALARRRHVTLVPEIDSPGHMEAALRAHPELQLTDASGRRQPDKLDVTNEAARAFYADLVDEYLDLFPGPWWHMGADEYLGIASTPADYELAYSQLGRYARAKHGPSANGKDAVLDFVDFVGDRVRARGRSLRVWSDGIEGGSAVPLDPAVAVEWWENLHSASPAELVERGHLVLNSGWWPAYYVTGGPVAGFRARVEEMYEEWDPWRFEGPYSSRWFGGPPEIQELPPGHERQLGATVNVWNDDPGAMSEQEIWLGINPRLRVLAQKTWASALLFDRHADFAEAVDPVSPGREP